MMNRRTISRILCASLALCVLACPVDAKGHLFGKKKKSAASTEAPAPVKKTPYEKFISKKGLVSVDSFMKLYRDGKDLWLEVPDEVIGRKLLLSSRLDTSDSPLVSMGMTMGKTTVFRIAKTDSLVLLTTPGPAIVSKDDNISAALKQSATVATRYAFPIKYRNADSTAVVIKVTDFLTDSKLINLKDLSYDSYTIKDATLKGDQRFTSIRSTVDRITLSREATWELSLDYGGNDVATKPYLTTEYSTSINLMEEKPLNARKADSRVGTLLKTISTYSSTGQIKNEDYACRWDITDGKKIRVYIDTVFSASWSKAIKEGIEVWNSSFEAAGLGSPIEALPMTADVDIDDPMVSAITYRGAIARKISAALQTDDLGNILSVKMRLPGDYVNGVRQRSVYLMSDVDDRYARYYISDEAVCEVLRAEVMQTMAAALGIVANYAGSYAYSPEQLRDPAFTQANGITASVTDDVLFNILARPGDKERGVATIIEKPGSYDNYAIAWLYADAPTDPEQLFIGKQAFPFDPRGIDRDLGNDPIEFFNSCLSHVKNLSSTCLDWIVDDSIPEEYTYLFVDWIWLNWGNNAFAMMKNVGGMYVNDIRDSVEGARFNAVPADLQKKCLKRFFDSLEELDFINKDLVHSAGLNKNVEYMTYSNIKEYTALRIRLLELEMSCKVAGSTYSSEQFMKDYQNYILKNVRKGILHEGEMLSLQKYISTLASESPLYKQNMNDVLKRNGFAIENNDEWFLKSDAAAYTDIDMPDGIPMSYLLEIEPLCVKYLRSTGTILRQGVAAAKDDFTRREIEFLCFMVESALEGRNN